MSAVASSLGVTWWLAEPAYATSRPVATAPRRFHRKLPGYEETPLTPVPRLADALGVGTVLVKDESARLGLPSFKMLGASWACVRALQERLHGDERDLDNVDDLVARLEPLRPLTLVAATDGNHGRGVARMASMLGLAAHVFVPRDMARARREAIEAEGARVTVIDGTYDAAVDLAKAEADDRVLVVSDTAWPGYETIPAWVIDGYSTIFLELDEQLSRAGLGAPDVVAVQMGVGALATAVVRHYRRRPGTRIVGVEPARAACIAESVRAGHPLTIAGRQDSIMAGLNCGTPSRLAWPEVSTGLDAYVVIDDDWARRAVRELAAAGLVSGESGAAGVAGLLALCEVAAPRDREALALTANACVLAISTEGATDPDAWTEIVGRPPDAWTEIVGRPPDAAAAGS